LRNIRNCWLALKRLLAFSIIGFILSSGSGMAKAETLPSSTTADWSSLLDSGWTCGQITGSRWNQWKKSVLLFAASNGYGFKGECAKISDRAAGDPIRPGTIVVIFRDKNNIVQYAGWYDSKLDRENQPIFGGISAVRAETHYDLRTTTLPYQMASPPYRPMYTMEERRAFMGWLDLRRVQPTAYYHILSVFESNFTYQNGCVTPFTVCGTGRIDIPISNGSANINIGFEDAAGTRVNGWLYEYHPPEPTFLEKLIVVAFSIGLAIQGQYIGEYIGLAAGTAENAAFAAGFSSFSTGLLQGQQVNQALLSGIKGAGLAYTGKLVLNAYGDPDSLVGVSGAGCPTGDQCWYFQMANGFPPLKHLAELHDPFINWSVKAFGSIGENGWYKAVTIAPFVVPGCLASDACVSAGITIVREDEIR